VFQKRIEWSALLFELLAVVVIVASVLLATARYLGRLGRLTGRTFDQYRDALGKSALFGFELLLAADVLRTIAVDEETENMRTLALLVLVRAFLSGSMEAEVETAVRVGASDGRSRR
jgi:uncharacterized membrane protein